VAFGVLSALPGLRSDGGVALAVLFSGGTFLHAALVHVLPSVHLPEEVEGPPSASSSGGGSGVSWAMVVGMALPPIAAAALPHAHHR
jgi:hypothetical protein